MQTSPISPMYTGQTLPYYQPSFDTNTGAVVPLTGATLSLKMVNLTTGAEIIGSGVWTIDNAAQGLAHYAWAAADTATAGNYAVYSIASFSGAMEYFQPEIISILPAP